MARKLMLVWLTLSILALSSISVTAEETVCVRADFFVKKVVINGNEIDNYNLQYPLVMYNSMVYMPLSQDLCRICGVEAEMDFNSRTLKLTKARPSLTQITHDWVKNGGEDVYLNILDNVRVYAFEEADKLTSIGDSFFEMPELGNAPILQTGQYIYVPLRLFRDSEIFGWDLEYDPYYGVSISSVPEMSALGYIDGEESKTNEGLVSYILKENRGLLPTEAQELYFLFKRAGETYGVDAKLVMAVASKESHFNTLAGAGRYGGAKGIMQIMPATAASMGVSENMLYDARTSINLGAYYIASKAYSYGFDFIKALSAYNQGTGSVNRGTYSTTYANKVLDEYYAIIAYIGQ